MKNASFFRVMAASLVAAFLFLGCAKAPRQEIAAAKASVEAAKVMNADVFAAEQYASATSYLETAIAEINVQNAKSPFSRNFEKSIKMLKETVAAANAAKNAVAANKAKMIADVKALLTAAQTSAAETKKAIEGVSKKNKDAAALGAKLNAAVVTLPKDAAGVTGDNVLAVQETVKSVAAQVGSIKADFEQLMAAKPAKGKGKKK
jgi:flagellar biosynthesis regulator FlaF